MNEVPLYPLPPTTQATICITAHWRERQSCCVALPEPWAPALGAGSRRHVSWRSLDAPPRYESLPQPDAFTAYKFEHKGEEVLDFEEFQNLLVLELSSFGEDKLVSPSKRDRQGGEGKGGGGEGGGGQVQEERRHHAGSGHRQRRRGSSTTFRTSARSRATLTPTAAR